MNRKKNKGSIKSFFLSFICFGIPMGLVFAVLKWNLVKGMLAGLLSGLLFAVMMQVFIIFIAIKMSKVRKELEKEHTVVYDGGCNHMVNKEGVGGWMFLLEKDLYFKSHKINNQVHEYTVPLAEIEKVEIGKKINSLEVYLKNGTKEEFIVNERKEWASQIKEQIKVAC